MNVEERITGIGGSDVASILGISRFKTIVELWDEKVNGITAKEPKPNEWGTNLLYWGKLMEPSIKQAYFDLTGIPVEEHKEKIEHKDFKWLFGHVDGFVTQDDEKMVFEAKICRHKENEMWGHDGSSKVPLEYMCQVQHYMHVTGLKKAKLAVLFLNNLSTFIYEINYSQDIVDEIMPALDRFWNFNVKENVAPQPTDYDDVRIVYNNPIESEIKASKDIVTKVLELNQVKMNQKMLSEQEKSFKKPIAEYMGNHTRLVNEYGETIATFLPRKDKVRVFRLV